MAIQGDYPLGNRQLANNDTVTGVVSGTTADIPLSNIVKFVISSAGSGPTSSRPVPSVVGQSFFDTSLGQPIWASQLSPIIWVNAAGVQV